MAVQVPVGSELNFRGVVDIVSDKAYTWNEGKEPQEGPVPAELADTVAEYRNTLIEALADVDEELGDKFLMEEEITREDIIPRHSEGRSRSAPSFRSSWRRRRRQYRRSAAARSDRRVRHSPLDGTVTGKHPDTGEEEKRQTGMDAPFSAYVFKSTADPTWGSSTSSASGPARCAPIQRLDATRKHDERIGQILIMRGKHQEPVPQVNAGDIAAVAKLQHVHTGDTLADKSKPIVYPQVEYPEAGHVLRGGAEDQGR